MSAKHAVSIPVEEDDGKGSNYRTIRVRKERKETVQSSPITPLLSNFLFGRRLSHHR